MNEIALESFISSCDDMIIAEEGFKDILKNAKDFIIRIWNTFMKKVKQFIAWIKKPRGKVKTLMEEKEELEKALKEKEEEIENLKEEKSKLKVDNSNLVNNSSVEKQKYDRKIKDLNDYNSTLQNKILDDKTRTAEAAKNSRAAYLSLEKLKKRKTKGITI